jgi:hypothetical protein
VAVCRSGWGDFSVHATAKYVGLVVAALMIISGVQLPTYALDRTPEALVGHWRKATIMITGRSRDEHLVLHANGIAEDWVVTASSRTPPLSGVWRAEGKYLKMQFKGRNPVSLPFTFIQGQLVFPNIPNKRGFWKK